MQVATVINTRRAVCNESCSHSSESTWGKSDEKSSVTRPHLTLYKKTFNPKVSCGAFLSLHPNAAFDEAGTGSGRYIAPRQFSTLLVEKVRLTSRKSLRFRAFTLIELLWVMAVIMILAALLFPGLRSARDKTKEVSCSSNLRQLGTSGQMYVNDFNGYLPRWYHSSSGGWHDVLINTGYINQWDNYRTNNKWLCCPSWLPAGMFNSHGGLVSPSYIYGIDQTFSLNGSPLFSKINLPSSCFLFGDSVKTNTLPQWYNFNAVEFSGYGAIHLRHNHKANIYFADGHTASCSREKLSEENQWGYHYLLYP